MLNIRLFIALKLTREVSIKPDQISSEVTVLPLNQPLMKQQVNNGAQLSGKLTQTQNNELSQMLSKDQQLLIVNSITLLLRLTEEALLLVVSKPMPNCLTRLLGRPNQTFTLTSLELSIETGIINQSHSTNLFSLTPTEE